MSRYKAECDGRGTHGVVQMTIISPMPENPIPGLGTPLSIPECPAATNFSSHTSTAQFVKPSAPSLSPLSTPELEYPPFQLSINYISPTASQLPQLETPQMPGWNLEDPPSTLSRSSRIQRV
jgi:hypothetical protein